MQLTILEKLPFRTLASANHRIGFYQNQKTHFGGFFVGSVSWAKSHSIINTIMKPYTYLIKHIPTGKVYYGYRSANKAEPADDLWKTYFTSSQTVHQLINESGVDSFEVEIRKIFETKEQASLWETRVLKRCKVLENNQWLNQNIAGYIVPTENSKRKISEFHKGKHKTDDHKKKISQSLKGKPKSDAYITTEYRELMSKLKSGPSNGRYGKEVSATTRCKISEANRGKVPSNKGKPMSEEQKAKIRATIAANKLNKTL